LFDQHIGKPLSFLGFHPDPSSASSTAKAVLTGVHFIHKSDSRNAAQHLPGFFVDAAMSPKIARIVIDNLLAQFLGKLEFTFIKLFCEILGKMGHLKAAALLRVFVIESNITVG
jgi:hypothetical protein